MDNARIKRKSVVKVIIFALLIGILLTCLSIIVGKKTYFSGCDYYPEKHLHIVDRGAPFKYFKVTPSESVCDPVDNVGAVWAYNVGNDISSKAFFADLAIWSAVGMAGTAAVISLKKKKQ
jgi:hypothetical protein